MATKWFPKNAVPEQIEYCGITAPTALWSAVGLQIVNWVGDQVEFPIYGPGGATDGELIEARVTTGECGEKALVWLIAERRRQSEVRAHTEAIRIAAEAQRKAGADAIHAARIHRQAEELHCLATKVNGRSIDSRLSDGDSRRHGPTDN